MAINLTSGHAYADLTTAIQNSVDTSMFMQFKASDVTTTQWIAGLCRSSSFGRARGILIEGGSIVHHRDTGSDQEAIIAAISVDTWYSVIVSGNNVWVDEYLDADAVTGVAPGSADTLDRATIGIKYSSGSSEYGDPTGLSVANFWYWDGTLTEAQRQNLIEGVDPATVNAANLKHGWDCVSDGTADAGAVNLTTSGTATFDAETGFASATPTITDIDGDESVYPGQSFVTTGTNFGATQGLGTVDIDGVTQTVTAWGDTSITCTAVRGGNEYGTGKTLTVTTDAATTATLGVAQEAEPGTFAVTAASPNTTDDASLWTGLIDTSTGDPVTVVDGDQAWVNTLIDGLAIAPDGTITANVTGTFTVQFWKASEGAWGSDQTVSFTLPAVIGGTIPRRIGVRSAVRSAVTRPAHSPVYRRA